MSGRSRRTTTAGQPGLQGEVVSAEAHATKPGNLGSIPTIHMVKRADSIKLSPNFHTCALASTHCLTRKKSTKKAPNEVQKASQAKKQIDNLHEKSRGLCRIEGH